MSDNLAQFVLARIAEDEEAARAATPGPWTVDSEEYAEAIHAGDGYTAVVAGGRWGGEASVFNETEDAIHIARWDPARVLAECAAKRAILEWHHKIPLPYERHSLLRLLALPYADHEGFREEWKVQ